LSLLGLEIGSSSSKGVVFNLDGTVLASATENYSIYSPSPAMFEIDAQKFWQAVVKITRRLSENVENDPIEALAISSQGETFVPVDKDGNEAGPAIMNSDNRAVEQTKQCLQTLGKEGIYRIAGVPAHPMFALNKIMWLKKHKPDDYARAKKFLSVGDYILMKMGLPPYTDYSLASRTMAFDINKKDWSDEILKCAGVTRDKLGIPLVSGAKAGRLSSSTASALGLKTGTIVAVGGHDQPCGAFGAGVINPGEVSDSAGTYEALVAASESPCNSQEALRYNLNSYHHVVKDRYITLAFFPAAIASRWFIEQFCNEERLQAEREGKTVYEIVNDFVQSKCPEPTGLCITPHFIGACNPHWDATATGVMVGLTPNITKYHIYKAIFEGIACELSINAAVLEEITGAFDRIKIYGGNAKSEFTVQLRADITGKQIQMLHNSEAVCQGAAMLAGMAAGIYKHAEDAVRQFVKIKDTFDPNAETSAMYAKQIKQYRLIYPSLKAVRNLVSQE